MISIQLNGESKEVPDPQSVQALLEWLKLPLDRIAVELNLNIVPRDRWQDTMVSDGDRLEVVHFVGGGSPSDDARADRTDVGNAHNAARHARHR